MKFSRSSKIFSQKDSFIRNLELNKINLNFKKKKLDIKECEQYIYLIDNKNKQKNKIYN